MAKFSEIVTFSNGRYSVDYKALYDRFEEFRRLETVNLPTFWHMEGNAWEHTKLVTNEALKKVFDHFGNEDYEIPIIIACLFHTIGMINTTVIDANKGTVDYDGYEEESSKIAMEIFKDESEKNKAVLSWLIINHTKPIKFYFSQFLDEKLVKLSRSTDYPSYCNIDTLCLISSCDNMGSLSERYTFWEEKLNYIKKVAKDLECLYTRK